MMVWGVGTTAKEVAEYEGLVSKAENNPDVQARKQGLASQALRGALKWGGPVHPPIPDQFIVQPHPVNDLETARPIRGSKTSGLMPVWKGLNEPYTGQPFAETGDRRFGRGGLQGGNRPVFVSPSYGGAHVYADIDRALSSPIEGFHPRSGTLLQGNIPASELRAGLHYNPDNEAHQVLMRAHQADLAFGKNAGLAPNLTPSGARTMHVPRVNKFALPFNSEWARSPVSTKVLGTAARLAPGAGMALGAYDTQRRFREGDYFGAGLGAISMVPGPIGWAGLGTQAIYDLTSWYLND